MAEWDRMINEDLLAQNSDLARPLPTQLASLFLPSVTTHPLPLDLVKTEDSSAQNCYFGGPVPPQLASLSLTPAPTRPHPQNLIKVEDLSELDCPLFPAWQLKDNHKDVEKHEEPLETEVTPAPPAPTSPCAFPTQLVTSTISNELASLPVKTENNPLDEPLAEENRNLSKCLHCNVVFSSEERLSHHVLIVHGKPTSDRLCHLCSDVSDGMHDDLVREMHMLLKHGLTTFRCSLCGFIEYERDKIAQHLSKNHVDLEPLTLQKLLSCLERPLCPSLVESCKEYFNSSATFTCEGQHNQSVARSTGSESKDVGGSRQSSSDEKDASTNLSLPSSRSSDSENVSILSLNKSKNVGALTPASLVSLISGKSSSNSTHDNSPGSIYADPKAWQYPNNSWPQNQYCLPDPFFCHPFQSVESFQACQNQAMHTSSQIPHWIGNDLSNFPTNAILGISREPTLTEANRSAKQFPGPQTTIRNTPNDRNATGHVAEMCLPSQGSTVCPPHGSGLAKQYTGHQTTSYNAPNNSTAIGHVAEGKSQSQSPAVYPSQGRAPSMGPGLHAGAPALPCLLTNAASETSMQMPPRGIPSVKAPRPMALAPHLKRTRNGDEYPGPPRQQKKRCSPTESGAPADTVMEIIDLEMDVEATSDSAPTKANNLAKQFSSHQTTICNTPTDRNAIDPLTEVCTLSQSLSVCPPPVDKSKESTCTNGSSLAKQCSGLQTTSYNAPNRNAIGHVVEVNSQSQCLAVHPSHERATSMGPGLDADAPALPCLLTKCASETSMQRSPRVIPSMKAPRQMALIPHLKSIKGGNYEYPDPPQQQKRRCSSTESGAPAGTIIEIIDLEMDVEATRESSPKGITETSPAARHERQRGQSQETVVRKPRCLSESSISRCRVRTVPRSQSLENITRPRKGKFALHSMRSLLEVERSQAFDGSFQTIRFCVVDHLLDVKSFFHVARDEIKSILNHECSKRSYGRLQVSVECLLSTKGVDDVVRNQMITIHSHCTSLDFCLNSTIDSLTLSLTEQFDATYTEFSGWTISRLKFTKFYLFDTCVKISRNKDTRRALIERHRKGVHWPQGVPGAGKVMVYDSQDSLKLAMIAHFVTHDLKKSPSDNVSLYRKLKSAQGKKIFQRYNVSNYFKFPSNLSSPVKLDDYSKIEIETQTSLFIYHLFKSSPGVYSFTLLRRGRKNVPEERVIHLVKILESSVLGLIFDFDRFASPFQRRSIDLPLLELIKSHQYCRFCFSCVKDTEYQKHLKACEDQIDEPNIIMPDSEIKFQFQNIAAMTPCYYVAYLSTGRVTKKTGSSNEAKVVLDELCAYSYCIVSKTGEISRKKTEILLENAASKCLYNLAKDYNELINDLQNTLCHEIIMTKKNKKSYNNATHCNGCLREFDDVTKKIKHHDPLKTGVFNNRGKLLEGNYITALCHICHMRSTQKKRLMPVVCLNSSPRDFHLLMKNLDESLLEKRLLPFAKTRNDLHYLTTAIATERKEGHHGLRLINLDNFMPGHFSDFAQLLLSGRAAMEFPKKLLRSAGYEEEALDFAISNTGLFPYKYLDSFDKLSETMLPSKEYFNKAQDDLTTSSNLFTQSQNLWSAIKCKTLKDYLALHLTTETSVLAAIFETFRKKVVDEYLLDPACYPSLQNFCIDAALYKKSLQIDLITDKDLFKLFEQNKRDNLITLITPYVKYNNKFCPDFDPNQHIESGLLLKFNSIYDTILSSKLPVGRITILTDEQMTEFDLTKAECDGKYAYALEIDYTIPDETKMITDDLPLSISKKTPQFIEISPFTYSLMKRCGIRPEIGTSNLLATHDDQNHYLISLQMLQLYMKLGLQVKKVHKIIRFRQSKCFKKYVSKNVEMCKSAENPWEKSIFQLMTSSLTKSKWDVSGMNRPRNFQVKIVRRNDFFKKQARSNTLKHCEILGENEVFAILSEPDVTLEHPTYLYFFIQEKIHFIIYNFYYKVLKKYYKDDVSLIYSDNETLLVSLKNVEDVFSEIKNGPLKNHLDTSNFPETHPLHDTSVRDELGRLKCVAADKLPSEFVALQPGIFSIKFNQPTSNDDTENNRVMRYHEHLKHVHLSAKHLESLKTSRGACESCLIREEKVVIPKIDDRRYYLNSNKSVAYGHPATRKRPSVGDSKINKSNDSLDFQSKLRLTNLINFRRSRTQAE